MSGVLRGAAGVFPWLWSFLLLFWDTLRKWCTDRLLMEKAQANTAQPKQVWLNLPGCPLGGWQTEERNFRKMTHLKDSSLNIFGGFLSVGFSKLWSNVFYPKQWLYSRPSSTATRWLLCLSHGTNCVRDGVNHAWQTCGWLSVFFLQVKTSIVLCNTSPASPFIDLKWQLKFDIYCVSPYKQFTNSL